MFNDQNVMAHSSMGVPSRVQIRYEARENYPKVIRGHSATNRSTLEEILYQGRIEKPLRFHRCRQLSCYSALLPKTNSKSLGRNLTFA